MTTFRKEIVWGGLLLPALYLAAVWVTTPTRETLLWLPHPAAKISVALLIAAMLPTPLMVIFRQARFPRWLRSHRRTFGVASFAYAGLHVAIHTGVWLSKSPIPLDFPKFYLTAGLISFAIMIPLAATSNDASVRKLGVKWKSLQRWTYLMAGCAFLHWIAIDNWKQPLEALVYFVPLACLQSHRIWYWRNRARRKFL